MKRIARDKDIYIYIYMKIREKKNDPEVD